MVFEFETPLSYCGFQERFTWKGWCYPWARAAGSIKFNCWLHSGYF